jgi:UDP-glucose:(heptosyl)LPS alpha-1,3-glucosyltransferase
MRIAVVRRVWSPSGGGAEKYALNITKELAARGHELSFAAEKFRGELPPSVGKIQIPRSFSPLSGPSAGFQRAVGKTLARDDFDIVYSLCRIWPADVLRVTEQVHAVWIKIGYPLSARLNPRHRAILRLEKKAFSSANTRFIVTNSGLVKNQVAEIYKYPEERIRVVRNGVDKTVYNPPSGPEERIAARRKLGIPVDKQVLLFAAANFKIKGLARAVETVAKIDSVRRGSSVLYVAGGDDPVPYRKLAAKLKIQDKVIFGGKSSDMRSLFIAADLFFFPSLYEPFANVCLEALACGLPVLTTALNGSSEMVTRGKNGYVTPSPDDTDLMAGHILDFISMSGARREAFSKAAAAAAERCDWKTHCDTLEEIFRRVADGKAGGHAKD